VSLLRHRYLVYLPFVLLFVGTVVGGWINTVDLRGRVVDDLSNEGIVASITFGQRDAKTDTTGAFFFPNLPKTSRLVVDSPGYFRATVPTTLEEIRLSPNSLTVVVKEIGVTPEKPIEGASIRQGDKELGKTLNSGISVISPYPGKDATLLICATGYDAKTITARGVKMDVELIPGTIACPPLPTPSPSPSPSPTASPSGSPAPSAAPTPSPSASP
jgi:hypothetical protein